MASPPQTPDDTAIGLLDDGMEALRYDQVDPDPYEVATRVAALVPEGARVLDVGCGSGCVTKVVLDQRNVVLLAVEPDATRAAFARARGINAYQTYITPEFLELHGPFDVILLVDVLEHMPAPGAFLRLLHAGLAPGGRVIASIPNVAHWSVRRQLARGHFHYERTGILDATHLRWFTRDGACRMFERMGFDVIATDWTLGMQMHCYYKLLPYRWMRPKLRKYLARLLVLLMPGAFACQNIVVAVARDSHR